MGMPVRETTSTTHSRMGAMTHRMEARAVSMVNVVMIPPTRRIGARMPMVWMLAIKFCTL